MDNDIWKWFGTDWKAHFAYREDYDHVMRWDGVRAGGVYYIPGYSNEYDAIVPDKLYDRVCKYLKLGRYKAKTS